MISQLRKCAKLVGAPKSASHEKELKELPCKSVTGKEIMIQ